jgi:type III secretion protein J
MDLDFLTPQIKRLVSNAIEGMSYDKVSVVLIEAEKIDSVHHAAESEVIRLAGFTLPYTGSEVIDVLVVALAVLAGLLLAAVGAMSFTYLRSRRKADKDKAAAAAEMEAA